MQIPTLAKVGIAAFVGKIAATLFVALCVVIGFGPDKWAMYLVAGTPFTPENLRIGLLVFGALVALNLIVPFFRKTIPRVEPIHLIAIGLVIAVIGLIWQKLEIDGLNKELANRPPSPVPGTSTSPPTAPQSPSMLPPPPPPQPKSVYAPDATKQHELLLAIEPLKSALPAKIWIVRPRDGYAQSLARILETVFRNAGFDAEQEEQRQTSSSQSGRILMAVPDPQNPPKSAIILADTMKKIGFDMEYIPLEKTALGFAIFVAMNRL
jgi:hypothetical protein